MNYNFGNPCGAEANEHSKFLILCGIAMYLLGEALPILLTLDYSFMKYVIKEDKLNLFDQQASFQDSHESEKDSPVIQVSPSRPLLSESKEEHTTKNITEIMEIIKDKIILPKKFSVFDQIGKRSKGLGYICSASINGKSVDA